MRSENKISYSYVLIFSGFLVFILYFFLYLIWYKNQTGIDFKIFDDSKEWLGLDKIGHFTTAFFESWITTEILKVNRQKSIDHEKNLNSIIYLGGLSGFALQFPIEILDGFSAGYGFSFYDLMANLAGSVAVMVQYLWWREVRIVPKITFFPSTYATTRPGLLGNNIIEQFIKDYNGQTYWISFSPNLFLKKKILPSWFNIAIGYGGCGLLGGDDNVWNDAEGYHNYNALERVPQFYLSVDINPLGVKCRNRFLSMLIKVLNIIKIPMPALEFQHSQFYFYLLYPFNI